MCELLVSDFQRFTTQLIFHAATYAKYSKYGIEKNRLQNQKANRFIHFVEYKSTKSVSVPKEDNSTIKLSNIRSNPITVSINKKKQSYFC